MGWLLVPTYERTRGRPCHSLRGRKLCGGDALGEILHAHRHPQLPAGAAVAAALRLEGLGCSSARLSVIAHPLPEEEHGPHGRLETWVCSRCGKGEARRYPYVAARLVLRLILVIVVVVMVVIVGKSVEFALGRGGWRELGRTHGVDGGEERRVGTEVRATGRKRGPRVERRNASGRRGDARVRRSSSSSSSRLCGHDW